MGEERTGAGKRILFYLAWSMIFSLAGCVSLSSLHREKMAEEHLRKSEIFLQKGCYEEALKENKSAWRVSAGSRPCDKALYDRALIWLDIWNPDRDYHKAMDNFRRLIREHPDSPLSGEAEIWMHVLSEVLNLKKEFLFLEEELRAADRKNDSLMNAVREYETRVSKLRNILSHKKRQIDDCRDQLERLKEIDLELNRKKGNNSNGTRKNTGSR